MLRYLRNGGSRYGTVYRESFRFRHVRNGSANRRFNGIDRPVKRIEQYLLASRFARVPVGILEGLPIGKLRLIRVVALLQIRENLLLAFQVDGVRSYERGFDRHVVGAQVGGNLFRCQGHDGIEKRL